MNQFCTFLFVKRNVWKKIIHNGWGGFSKWISEDTVNTDTWNSHTILVAVFLSGTHIGKFETISGKLTESPDISRWNKRSFNDIKAKKIGNPFCITFVSFLTLYGFDILGMSKDNVHMRLKDVKNRDPVFTGGFHADMQTVIREKPVTHSCNLWIVGGEGFHFISCFQSDRIRNADSSNNRFFVNIQPSTDKVFHFKIHVIPPFKESKKRHQHWLSSKRKDLSWKRGFQRHQVPTSKMISVRARSPNCLCLKEDDGTYINAG